MNVKVPLILKDRIKTDGEAMVIAFLLMICKDHGFGPYNFNSHDIRKLFKGVNSAALKHDSRYLENLRSMVSILALDDHNWILQFKDYNEKIWCGNRKPKLPRIDDYKLQTTQNMVIWSFAMGRYTAPGLVFESSDTFFYKDSSSDLKQIHWDNFKIMTA